MTRGPAWAYVCVCVINMINLLLFVRVLMRPGRAAGSGKTQLQVGAQHVCRDSSSTDLRGECLMVLTCSWHYYRECSVIANVESFSCAMLGFNAADATAEMARGFAIR
jgi:hypothetical protein